MLLKLVWYSEKRFTIQSGIKNVEIYTNTLGCHCLMAEYEDGSKINYLLNELKEDGTYQDVCTAYLMNNKGETIEKIQ